MCAGRSTCGEATLAWHLRPAKPIHKVWLVAGDALDAILAEALGGGAGGEEGSGEGQGLLAQVGGTVASLQRFMRSLSQ